MLSDDKEEMLRQKIYFDCPPFPYLSSDCRPKLLRKKI